MKFMQNEQSSIPLFHSMFSLRIRLKSHIRNPRRACYWNGTFHIRENQRTHNISTDTWNHFGLSGLCCAANTSTNPHWDVRWAFILVTSNVASLGSWLCQHIDLWDVAVETIADRDINEPVVGTQWNCRLGTLVCQGGQSSPRTTSKNDSKNTLRQQLCGNCIQTNRLNKKCIKFMSNNNRRAM